MSSLELCSWPPSWPRRTAVVLTSTGAWKRTEYHGRLPRDYLGSSSRYLTRSLAVSPSAACADISDVIISRNLITTRYTKKYPTKIDAVPQRTCAAKDSVLIRNLFDECQVLRKKSGSIGRRPPTGFRVKLQYRTVPMAGSHLQAPGFVDSHRFERNSSVDQHIID